MRPRSLSPECLDRYMQECVKMRFAVNKRWKPLTPLPPSSNKSPNREEKNISEVEMSPGRALGSKKTVSLPQRGAGRDSRHRFRVRGRSHSPAGSLPLAAASLQLLPRNGMLTVQPRSLASRGYKYRPKSTDRARRASRSSRSRRSTCSTARHMVIADLSEAATELEPESEPETCC
ncbi:hypothetical protein BJ546DRAFT_297407 [Cryomyces antarcticus]